MKSKSRGACTWGLARRGASLTCLWRQGGDARDVSHCAALRPRGWGSCVPDSGGRSSDSFLRGRCAGDSHTHREGVGQPGVIPGVLSPGLAASETTSGGVRARPPPWFLRGRGWGPRRAPFRWVQPLT